MSGKNLLKRKLNYKTIKTIKKIKNKTISLHYLPFFAHVKAYLKQMEQALLAL